MTDFIDRVKALRDRTALYPGALLGVAAESGNPHLAVVYVSAVLPCSVDGIPARQCGRDWLLDWKMTDNQIFNTFLLAWLTFVEHEAREVFKVDGKALYEPKH